jgi:hypothetical protein
MRECRVDNVGAGKTKHKFPHRNAGKKSSFAEQSLVCGALEVE